MKNDFMAITWVPRGLPGLWVVVIASPKLFDNSKGELEIRLDII